MDMNIVFRAIQNEMQPSMGCTEPVAIGLAVSRTCEYLEQPAEGLDMVISSNIFKNAYRTPTVCRFQMQGRMVLSFPAHWVSF